LEITSEKECQERLEKEEKNIKKYNEKARNTEVKTMEKDKRK
jgi:hypothetical protein